MAIQVKKMNAATDSIVGQPTPDFEAMVAQIASMPESEMDSLASALLAQTLVPAEQAPKGASLAEKVKDLQD